MGIAGRYSFLFSELVKRDFKKKYKSTYLGMLWSLLSPLLSLLVMSVVFGSFFGRDMEHYTIYLFCGNVLFSYFSDATVGGMGALVANAPIFTHVRVPKLLFVLSRSVSSLINAALTFAVLFIFILIDGVRLTWALLLSPLPLLLITVFNVGVGLALSVLFVFFRDMKYLWGVATMLISYLSAIFYTVSAESFGSLAGAFYLNPVYVYITYLRTLVLGGTVPPLWMNALAVAYALIALGTGLIMYRKCNYKFIYYV